MYEFLPLAFHMEAWESKPWEFSLNYFSFLHVCNEFPSSSPAFMPAPSAAITRPGYVAHLSPWIPNGKHSILVPVQLSLHHSSGDRGLSDADSVIVLS